VKLARLCTTAVVVDMLVVEDDRGVGMMTLQVVPTNILCLHSVPAGIALSDLKEIVYVDDNLLVQEPKLTDLACYCGVKSTVCRSDLHY
jgi:hypothetical protein